MSNTSTVAEWTRQHSETSGLGHAVPEVIRTEFTRGEADEVHAAPLVAVGPEPLGAPGGLARVLTVLLRRPYEGAGDRRRTRASVDRLVETIRALSAL